MGVERGYRVFGVLSMQNERSLPLLVLHFERSFKAKLVLSPEIRPKLREIERSVKT